VPITTTSAGLSLKEALLNQYQAILVGGAAAFSLVAGEAWPFLVLGGLECLALPLVVGNARLARALAMRRLDSDPVPATAAAAAAALALDGLSLERQRRFQELQELARSIEKNYARLSEVSRPLLEEQRSKLRTVLETALARLKALQAYDDLDGARRAAPELSTEVAELERKVADPATAPALRDRYVEALDFKRRLAETLRRSGETREVLATEIGTLKTTLEILAQESAALTAPSEVAARLDEIVRSAAETGEVVRELEEIAEENRRSLARRATTTA
jgi:hypothetical protein